jgi:hypothetical protein
VFIKAPVSAAAWSRNAKTHPFSVAEGDALYDVNAYAANRKGLRNENYDMGDSDLCQARQAGS